MPTAFVALAALALACGRAERRPGAQDGDASAGAQSSGGRASTGTSGASAVGAEAGVELSHVELEGAPIYARAQRLTNRQWEHAVTDILGFTEPQGLSTSFAEPVSGLTDFDNNEKLLFVDARSFGDFEVAAEAAATLATSSPQAMAALYTGSDAAGLVQTLGRRAFRRPLTADEQTKYEGVFALGERLYGPGFENGAALVVRALLQSPHFLYRTELGPPGEALSGYEIASKLSFWLLGTTPSDALLDTAKAGELESDAGLEAAAQGMLQDPRAIETMRDFHEQLLSVRRYAGIVKDGVPEYDAAINAELAIASDAFLDRVFQKSFGLRELLTSSQAYVGPGLAPLYGMTPPASALELRELGPARAGYFMQVPFLMLFGANEQSDPIHRALEIQKMSCAPMGVPPHTPLLPPLMPGETNRQRFSKISESCGAGCHAVNLDPLGFALENFDGLGRERDQDNGQPIDTASSYPFAEGVAEFADGKELMNIMAASEQVHTCYAKKVTSYALGRDMVELDRPLLESLARVSLSGPLKELAMVLVRSPEFRTREARLP
jgi:hypothetical protein